MRGTTKINDISHSSLCISIHVPREGDDSFCLEVAFTRAISIHVPREGDDSSRIRQCESLLAISIHVPREGDDDSHGRTFLRTGISIHVPREGDDVLVAEKIVDDQHFNPRPP